MRDRLRRIPVRANLERVFVLDLEEIGNLRKDPGYSEVFHLKQILTTEDTEENTKRTQRMVFEMPFEKTCCPLCIPSVSSVVKIRVDVNLRLSPRADLP